MHRQLQPIVDDYRAASARLHALVEATPASAWPTRTDPDRWSMAECVAHLNLTGAAVLPRHEHRHIWQAEQVWAALQRRGVG